MAFPTLLHEDALFALGTFPPNPYPWNPFKVKVVGEEVSLPYRVYHNAEAIKTAGLNNLQQQLVACLLTRHRDGFVRQRSFRQIPNLNRAWVVPFVIQLSGEYVAEILQDVCDVVGTLDFSVYAEFAESNPAFIVKTKQRIVSYWDCYWRSIRKENYAGFKIIEFLNSLQRVPT